MVQQLAAVDWVCPPGDGGGVPHTRASVRSTPHTTTSSKRPHFRTSSLEQPLLPHADPLQHLARGRIPGHVVRVDLVQAELVEAVAYHRARRFRRIALPPPWHADPVAELGAEPVPVDLMQAHDAGQRLAVGPDGESYRAARHLLGGVQGQKDSRIVGACTDGEWWRSCRRSQTPRQDDERLRIPAFERAKGETGGAQQGRDTHGLRLPLHLREPQPPAGIEAVPFPLGGRRRVSSAPGRARRLTSPRALITRCHGTRLPEPRALNA